MLRFGEEFLESHGSLDITRTNASVNPAILYATHEEKICRLGGFV
jgi:hypothetical protein